MYAADGVGLAAPQIGLSERLVVIDVGDGPLHLVNPELVSGEGTAIDREGCLSIPGVYGYVERYERVIVTALDAKSKPRRIQAEGWLARALQHEIDHLDGILFIDKAARISRQGELDDPAEGARDATTSAPDQAEGPNVSDGPAEEASLS